MRLKAWRLLSWDFCVGSLCHFKLLTTHWKVYHTRTLHGNPHMILFVRFSWCCLAIVRHPHAQSARHCNSSFSPCRESWLVRPVHSQFSFGLFGLVGQSFRPRTIQNRPRELWPIVIYLVWLASRSGRGQFKDRPRELQPIVNVRYCFYFSCLK